VIVERSDKIRQTPDAVFAVLSDPTTWAAYDHALVDVQPQTPLRLGLTGTIRRRVGLGMTVTTAWKVLELDPPTRLVLLDTGRGYELRETLVLAATATGTSMTVTDTLVPTSLPGRLMVALSGRFIERDLKSRLVALKAVLEGGPAAPG
jgi:hypothetical protein